MKSKFLLLLIFITAIVNAQEPNRSLVITEYRGDQYVSNYIELTNMGTTPIDLSEFKFARMTGKVYDVNLPWVTGANQSFFLPNYNLQPGESYVVTRAYDFHKRMYDLKYKDFPEVIKQSEMYKLANFAPHLKETKSEFYPEILDSITPGPNATAYQNIMHVNGGGLVIYIEHHYSEGDSAVVDQVNGVFQANGNLVSAARDVAGVASASANSILIRKSTIKTGNPDFANARGLGRDDSEWIVIPRNSAISWDKYRDVQWTVGNHGPFVLDENTLESDVIEIDFANKKLTVPWGTKRLDGIMRLMKKKPGIAWQYNLNSNPADSLYQSVRTGDKLTIFVCGDEHQEATFDIVVKEPNTEDNIVVPVAHPYIALNSPEFLGVYFWEVPLKYDLKDKDPNQGNLFRKEGPQSGILGWPRVTQHENGIDTITGYFHGLPYNLRIDTLFKYLEKPTNATWELLPIDGVTRPDLKNGDKLKVTAQNGTVKEYFIQIQHYIPNGNAELASITWPDIPSKYKGIYGWVGDTIPAFNSAVFNYQVRIPTDVENIPALVASTRSENAQIEVIRAKSYNTTLEEATISFMVTAEDGITKNTYTVELYKEKKPTEHQENQAEPFFSEMMNGRNAWFEIVNPGNIPLDLSDYMIIQQNQTDLPSAIRSRSEPGDWLNRYDKYVPGYKWVDSTTWRSSPGRLELDVNVNALIYPGDVFVGARITYDYDARSLTWKTGRWDFPDQIDVLFNIKLDGLLKEWINPWKEPVNAMPVGTGRNSTTYLLKILNDSIKNGLKPANDPNDFKLIDVFGMVNGTNWVIGGRTAADDENFIRKPHIQNGNTVVQGSFGTNPIDSEWTYTNRSYWQARNVGWPQEVLWVHANAGLHYLYEITHYKSTVKSKVYKVSEGYSSKEEISGIINGATVETFMENIIKADTNQTLKVKAVLNGLDLELNSLISNNDTLIVLSADSINTTKYVLKVSDTGLSSNAVLTSQLYEIVIENDVNILIQNETSRTGFIKGFDYGTLLKTVAENLTIPSGAKMSIINSRGSYVPFKQLNYDTTYVDLTVNSNIYFEVIAEDGITSIMYQLLPNSSEDNAFVLSDLYQVVQTEYLIKFVPRGTNVQSILLNLVPSTGATVEVFDKLGNERTDGIIAIDDRVVVTSSNGLVTKIYHISVLGTKFIPETTYLAYVLSNEYEVDQLEYIIAGLSEGTSISEFYSKIIPSMGATVKVVDSDGNDKLSGSISTSDKLKVISIDEKIIVFYDISFISSVARNNSPKITIYPNPTLGKLYIKGVEQGNRIQCFNTGGVLIYDMFADKGIEMLSLNSQSSGLYFIIISDKNYILSQFKVLKK